MVGRVGIHKFPFLLSNRMLLSTPWVKVNRCKSKRWKSHHWILHNWLVWMYPKEFTRPVKQKVLAQAKCYAYVCKQLLLLGVCNAFLWRSFTAWKHLLAFMHTAHCFRLAAKWPAPDCSLLSCTQCFLEKLLSGGSVVGVTRLSCMVWISQVQLVLQNQLFPGALGMDTRVFLRSVCVGLLSQWGCQVGDGLVEQLFDKWTRSYVF